MRLVSVCTLEELEEENNPYHEGPLFTGIEKGTNKPVIGELCNMKYTDNRYEVGKIVAIHSARKEEDGWGAYLVPVE